MRKKARRSAAAGAKRLTNPDAGGGGGTGRTGREDPVLAKIREAVEGLVYPSESDAPFEPVQWEADRPPEDFAAADAQARGGKAGPVERVPVADFFAGLEGTEDAGRFQALREALESSLSDVQVFRVGARKVHVYLVGRTAAGTWLGLHTTSVET